MCTHKNTGFTIALVKHSDTTFAGFSETNTGLDHLGFAAANRDELVAGAARLDAAGVASSAIHDMPLGYHLNFRDPDGIALDLQAPNEVYAAAPAQMHDHDLLDAAVLAKAAELVGPEFVAKHL